MIYIELYLYDYLKKNNSQEQSLRENGIELWGEEKERDFYICHLRHEGGKKPYYKAHVQCLGEFLGLEDAGGQKGLLVYRRREEICRREAAAYVSKDTEQIEHFLIGERGGTRKLSGRTTEKAFGMPRRADADEKPEAKKKIGSGGRQAAVFFKTTACLILIFLVANMIEALSTYENMQEVIAVAKILVGYK